MSQPTARHASEPGRIAQALLGPDALYAGLYATRDDSAVVARPHAALAERAKEGASFAPRGAGLDGRTRRWYE